MALGFAVYNQGKANSGEYLLDCMRPLRHSGKESPGIISADGKDFYGFDEEGSRLNPEEKRFFVMERYARDGVASAEKKYINGEEFQELKEYERLHDEKGSRYYGYYGPDKRKVYVEDNIDNFKGGLAVGQICYGGEERPYFFYGKVVIAFDGTLTNRDYLEKLIVQDQGTEANDVYKNSIITGHILYSSGRKSLKDMVGNLDCFDGSFNIIIATPDEIAVIRDPEGTRPLSIGRFDEGILVSPETVSFDMIRNVEYAGDAGPGEALFLPGDLFPEPRRIFPEKKKRHCIREAMFYATEGSRIFEGLDVEEFRYRSGIALAEENTDIKSDFVLKNAGEYAEGYKAGSRTDLIKALVKNYTIGTRNVERFASLLEKENNMKNKYYARRSVRGKEIVLPEDSVLDGIRLKAKVLAAVKAGAKKVHVLVGSPEIMRPCTYGRFTRFRSPEELWAYMGDTTLEDVTPYIGEMSFLPLERALGILGDRRDDFCVDCLRE